MPYPGSKRLGGRVAVTVAIVLFVAFAVASARDCAAADSFRNVEATDGTFSVAIPADWEVEADQVTRFAAWGPQGQSVAWGALTFIDRFHYRRFQGLLGPSTARQIYPLVSDPLAPRDFLRIVLPRLNSAVKSVEILGEKPMADPYAASESYVLYRYTLIPSAGIAAQIPPPLRAGTRTAMEGSMLIETTPPNSDGVWTLAFWGTFAPDTLFPTNAQVSAHVFRSLHYDVRRILQMIAEQQRQRGTIAGGMIRSQQGSWERANATISQFGSNMMALQQETSQSLSRGNLKAGQGAIEALGGPTQFHDAEGNSYSFQLNRNQQSDRYQCVNGYGGTAQYYGSSTQDCTELGSRYGLNLRALRSR